MSEVESPYVSVKEAAKILGAATSNVRKRLRLRGIPVKELAMGPIWYREDVEWVRDHASGRRSPEPDVVGVAEAAQILGVRNHSEAVVPRLEGVEQVRLSAGPCWPEAAVKRAAKKNGSTS